MWFAVVAAVVQAVVGQGSPYPIDGPALSSTEPTPAEKLLAEPRPEPQFAATDGWLPAHPLAVLRTPVLATPLPEREVAPRGAILAAPVISPRVKHGRLKYDVIPAGRVDHIDPVATRHPDNFVFESAPHRRPWKVWGSAELLLGTTSGVLVPPLVTTGPATRDPFGSGRLGLPETQPLFGGRNMLYDWRAGVLGELGVWFDDAQVWGGFGRFYSLYSTSEQAEIAGNNSLVIAVPRARETPLGLIIQDPFYIAYPGVFPVPGRVSTTAQTNFAGGDISLRRMLRQGAAWRLDVVAGYRQLHLGDELGVDLVTAPEETFLGPGSPVTLIFDVQESLRTRNNFYGVHLGGIASATWRQWSVEGFAAVGLGVNAAELNEDVSIPPADFVYLPVHVNLAEQTCYLSTVWEGGIRIGFRVSEYCRLTMGYTGLWWWNVRRAQEQYTFTPELTIANTTTDFAVHMLSWGAELRY